MHGFLACLLRATSLPHQFHDQKGPHRFHHRFAEPRGRRAADFRIHEEARAKDGAVAHASVHFVGQSTRRASASQSALVVHRQQPNGVVVLDVDDGPVIGRLAPVFPGPA